VVDVYVKVDNTMGLGNELKILLDTGCGVDDWVMVDEIPIEITEERVA